jgi:hypothetical protein
LLLVQPLLHMKVGSQGIVISVNGLVMLNVSRKRDVCERKEVLVVYFSAANITFEVNYFYLNCLYLLSLKEERSEISLQF